MNRLSPPSQSGFSLLELCISMAVYSAGLGGFSLLLILSMQSTVNAQNRTWAAFHTSSIAERAIMNANADDHRIFTGQADHDNWHDLIGKQLPGGAGVVCSDSTPNDGTADDPACDGSGPRLLKVFWATPGGPDEARVPGRMASHLPK